MIKDFLKRPYLWLFLWIGFFLLIFLCPVGKAELKTFYKGYPWGTTDTSSASNQRELAWERSKGFSFVLEGMADIGGIRILYDRPAIIMYYYDGDTAAFNAWAITRPGKIDSMYAWITRNSYYIDSCYLHWDSTRVYTSIFLEAYDDTNDLDADGIRDFDSYAGFVNIQGFNYIVDSSANWTTNEWIGKGIYDLAGNLIDTVIYNSPETLYYNVMDTTNFVTNWSFETGDSLPTGWLRHGTGRLERTTETAFDDSYSIKVNGNATYGDVAVKQLSIQTPLHCLYVFQASYKTDADFNGTHSHVLLGVLRGGNEGYALNSYFVPSESADGNWHTYRDTFTNYETGAWRESMVVYLGAFPAAEGDTTWNTDDSIYFDAIKLFSINGSLPTWGQFGDFWESKYYYPFIIDSLGIYNHTATAQVESLTRISPWVEYDLGLYTLLANTHYEGYRNFQKWWCGKIFDIRASEGFDGIFEDESWSYTPIAGRFWSKEYGISGSGLTTADSFYRHDRVTLQGEIWDTLKTLGKYIFINSNDTEWFSNVDGVLFEGLESGGWIIASNWDSLYSGSVYPFNYYKNHLVSYHYLRDRGKILLNFSQWNGYEQSATNELITRYDSLGQLGRTSVHYAEFENSFAGRNRSRVSSLAWYYIIASDSTYYWYEINYGYLPREFYGTQIQDIDIGDPVDTAYEWYSGIDDSGIPYVIVGRKYVGGIDTDGDTVLVLYKPKSFGNDWWSCYGSPPCTTLTIIGGFYNTDNPATWDNYPPTVHSLNGIWFPYRWDATLDQPITEVSLRFSEGCILRQVCH